MVREQLFLRQGGDCIDDIKPPLHHSIIAFMQEDLFLTHSAMQKNPD